MFLSQGYQILSCTCKCIKSNLVQLNYHMLLLQIIYFFTTEHFFSFELAIICFDKKKKINNKTINQLCLQRN